MRGLCAFAVAATLASCVKPGAFECASADQCVRDGVQGRCESVSYCSFPDEMCPSGQRFGEHAGTLADRCVGDTDGGVPPNDATDAPNDGMIDAPMAGCPGSYTTLAGAPNRYRKLANAAPWQSHESGCQTDGGPGAYLAIPNDAAELAAIASLAGVDTWVGVSDRGNEGAFQDVLGSTSTFLPWAGGEPDNGGNQDCVSLRAATQQFETLSCNTQRIAVCECVP
jgi:hypothetical protein